MIQKKFLYKDLKTAEDALPRIRRILEETPHKCALLTFYETGLKAGEIEDYVALIRELGFPELQIAGISLTVIAELMPEGNGILLNLILTEEAGIEVVTLPCTPGGEDEAADILNRRLEASGNVKAVELFGSNMSLKTTRFMERAMKGHEDAALFGTCTIRNLPTKLSVEDNEQVIELEQGDPAFARDELVYGDKMLFDGFVAIIFYGQRLICKANYALGWSPIGRRLNTELGENASKGETVVKEVNGFTAVDIYREYLGVYPDSYLISNICEFPFIVEREGINIGLIPIDCNKDGELFFMMTLNKGECLRFSFASHDEVLNASRSSLDSMERFKPETLFLTLCGNRINFLKEDAHLEWDGFKKVSPDHALMHGSCELYYQYGKGGILNSAHLAIGLKEGVTSTDAAGFDHIDVESLRHGRTMALSDRMSVFLRKITSELKKAVDEANDANTAKSAFLSHMSHEIRTPINAILGMDEMIIRESSEDEVIGYAEDIRSAGNNLLGIVNDVLDFSKIEAGKMNIIPVEYEVASIINDMYNIVLMRAGTKGLAVKLDIDPTIPSLLYGDETRIKQVITNLLTNAVKYTEDGSVTLRMERIEEGSDGDGEALKRACPGDQCPDVSVRIRVTVEDTGIGIRPEDMERLFVEYQRMEERRNRKVEGTGLGLSITSELLELMGSRLFVESTYGKGSVFGFEIVQGVLGAEGVGKISGRYRKTETRKYRVKFTAEDAWILVVDDTKVNLDVIRNLLKRTKIHIDTALSGEEALKLVQENEYDVIFLDHLMPKMDGPETLKRMKALEVNLSKDAPVISLTANAASGIKDEYIKAGFRDYLAKPVNPQRLEDMLFELIPQEKVRTVSDPGETKLSGAALELPAWLLENPRIDAEEGLKNCGTPDTYLIVLGCFFEMINDHADEIEECYRNRDWENYRIKVHALKSSAKTIGATELSDKAAGLEQAGRDADTEFIDSNTEALLEYCRSLKEELSPIAQ